MNSLPKVSVVMASWNRRDEIRETLTELQQQDYPDFEVIVVDNNSQDGSAELIEEEFRDVRLIRLPRNIGTDSRNIGIANARGEIVVFLDDDAILEKDWIGKAANKFDKEPQVAILASRILNYYTKEISDWIYETDANTFGDREFETFNFVGCAAAIRKSALDKVGLFPEENFLYGEEGDLSIRIIDLGYEIRYYPDLIAYHRIPSGQNVRINKRRMYYLTRNTIWHYWKYYPLSVALIASFFRIPHNLKSAFGLHYSRVYLKAVLDAFLALPKILKKRKPVKKETLRKVSTPKLKWLIKMLFW